MGMADIAEVLWNGHLRHNPANPAWPDRDRFVLSNGHGSMLIYALLHLAGYDLPMAELENFRQLHSRTAGHPEYRLTPGVETTTGPLGQGLANAVGMAIVERALAARSTGRGTRWWTIARTSSRGTGVSWRGSRTRPARSRGPSGSASSSWSGTTTASPSTARWRAGSPTTPRPASRPTAGKWCGTWTATTPRRCTAAIAAALGDSGRPSLLCCRTTIGWGAPDQGGHRGHPRRPARGGRGWRRRARRWAGRTPPSKCRTPSGPVGMPERTGRSKLEIEWRGPHGRVSDATGRSLPGELERRLCRGASCRLGRARARRRSPRSIAKEGAAAATRKASQIALEHFAPHLPELVGGSADLTGSNLTMWSGLAAGHARRARRQLHLLRGTRIRDVRDRERNGAPWGGHPLCRDVPRLLRLRAKRDSHGRPHAAPDRFRADPRFDRPRRGRPDPPGGRARPFAPARPEPVRVAALRYRRGGGGVALRDRARGRPGLPAPLAPGCPAPSARVAADRGDPAGGLRPRAGAGGTDPRRGRHRHRLGGGSRGGGGGRARQRRLRGAGRLHAVHRRLRRSGRSVPERGAAAGGVAGGRRGLAPGRVAQVRGPGRALQSASKRSASRPRRPTCTGTSGSRPKR